LFYFTDDMSFDAHGDDGQQVVAATPGFSVKESEEKIRVLEKDNFNLKLKIYFLELQLGIEKPKVVFDKEYVDLVLENEMLKAELEEKLKLMKEALLAIDKLQAELQMQEVSSSTRIDFQSKKIKKLEMTLGTISKKSGVAFEPSNRLPRLEEEIRVLKSKNIELFARINELKTEISGKNQQIAKLTIEHEKFQHVLQISDQTLMDYEVRTFYFFRTYHQKL